MDSTILLQYLTAGDEKAIAANRMIQSQLLAMQNVVIELGNKFKIENEEVQKAVGNLTSLSTVGKAAAQSIKKLADAEQMAASAIGRFLITSAGGAANLKKLEASAYQATRQSVLMSQQLALHPIQTLKQFAASAEKAAITADYFKQQLAFLASSRFGSIILFAAAFATISKTIEAVIRANIELDASIHRVASAYDASEKTLKTYSDIQHKIIMGAVEFGQTYKDVGEILWELKSAGLSVNQTYSSLETVQRLVAAGATDINQSTRMMAGLYRSFGDEMKNATTEEQKFAEIGGVIAYVLNKSQGDVQDITQALKYAAGTAKQTGVSFNELAATILVSNNALLYGSTAGTSFSQALVNISKNWQKYSRDFNIAIDPTKPLKWAEVINTLAKNQALANKEIGAMGQLAQDANVRALRSFLANTQGVDEFNAALKRLNEGGMADYLKTISDERMLSFENQWKRIKELTASLVATGGSLDFVTNFMKASADRTLAFEKVMQAYKTAGDNTATAWLKATAALDQWDQKSIDVLKASKELEKIVIGRAVEQGVQKAVDKMKEFQRVSYKTFSEILNDEEKERLNLLLGNNLLQERIEKTVQLLIQQQEEAVQQASINIKSEEAKKAREAVFALEEKLITLEKQRTAEIQKQHEEELKNTNAIDDYLKKISSLKSFTPIEELQKNADLLELAKRKVIDAKVGTDDWRKAMGKLADATVTVENGIKKAGDAAKNANDELIKTSMALLNFSKELNPVNSVAIEDQARELLRVQKEAADWKVINSSKDDEELKNLLAKDKIIEDSLKSGLLLDIEKNNYQNQLMADAARELELRQRMADAANAALDKYDNTEELASKTKVQFEDIYKSIQDSSLVVSVGLNTGLENTSKILTEITMKAVEFANALKSANDTSSSSNGGSSDVWNEAANEWMRMPQ